MRKYLSNILIAVSIALVVAMFLPLQTYLGSRSDYSFGLTDFLWQQSVISLTLAGLLVVLMRISDRWLKGMITNFLVAFLIMIYAEAILFSFGLGEINGAWPNSFGQINRIIWDSAVWTMIFLAAIIFRRFVYNYAALIAVGVLLLCGASLFDVRRDDSYIDKTEIRQGGSYVALGDLVNNITYSPKRNVIFIVLDEMPATVADEIMAADVNLRAKFPGFVAYRQNIGMHERTKRGVPGLLTGIYFGDETKDKAAYLMSAVGPKSFVEAFKKHGDRIYCVYDMFSYGYTSEPNIKSTTSGEQKKWMPIMLRTSNGVPYVNLLDTLLYRVAPFGAKEKLLYSIYHNRHAAEGDGSYSIYEHRLFPLLASRPVDDDVRTTFIKIHTKGSHMPLEYDLEGNPTGNPARDNSQLLPAVSNALVHTSRLLEAYRQKGIYDQSMIVITTDHGSQHATKVSNLESAASAILWVKPEGVHTPFEVSEAKTSHSHIASLMRAAAEKSLSRTEIDGLLHCEDRRFSYIDDEDCFQELHY